MFLLRYHTVKGLLPGEPGFFLLPKAPEAGDPARV